MNEEKLNELLEVEKKNLRCGRIRMVLLAILTVALVICTVFVVSNLNTFNKTTKEFGDNIQTMAEDFKEEILTKIDDLELEQVDLEKVNAAVTALKDAANNLSEVDVDTLNDLVKELENVA